MKRYSIIRIGNEYVVRAGGKSILKISSRRRATRLVYVAAGLLDSEAAQQAQAEARSSIDRDAGITLDPTLDPGIVPDPESQMLPGIPDPQEVP